MEIISKSSSRRLIAVGVLVSVTMLGGAMSASAATEDISGLLSRISSLQAQIATLEAQLQSQGTMSILRTSSQVLSASIGIGSRVQTTAALNVRSGHNLKSSILCTQPIGTQGTIMQGPSGGNGYTWWYVQFDTSCSGWSVQDYLAVISIADTTPPSVPTGLSASAISSSQINLSWNASTDTGGSGLAGYKVFRGGTQIATTASTNYSDSGLSPSTTYTYTVAAYDNAGNTSAQSGSVSATTLAAPALSASASASPTSGTAPLAVSFTGSASGGTSPYTYSWNFGDSTTASTQNPSHTYSTAGTYTATLTVYDSGAQTAISYVTITVTTSGGSSVNINGVYDLGSDDATVFPSVALTNPSVDGLAMRANWKTLEPSDGSFNWSEIDSVLQTAQANNKKVSISVDPGVQSPSWLYSEGAQSFTYKWDHPWGGIAFCANVQLPVPWDPLYEQKWGAFIAAFGARYDGNPLISHVKLTGVNAPTQETNLPHSTGGTSINGGQCVSNNDVANWQTLGYTRTKVENAWKLFSSDFNTAFPHKEFAAMLQPCPGGLPPIDQNGNVISGATCDAQGTADILNYGISLGRGRFVAQNNGWSSTWISAMIVNAASSVDTGYQELGALGSNFPTAATTAVNDGAKFLEVYPVDITDTSLQSAITTAHNGLLANGGGTSS